MSHFIQQRLAYYLTDRVGQIVNVESFWNKHLPPVVAQPQPITKEKARSVREWLRLTRHDVANGVGVSVDLVKKWETGKRPINGYSEQLMDYFIAEARKFSQKIETELTQKKY